MLNAKDDKFLRDIIVKYEVLYATAENVFIRHFARLQSAYMDEVGNRYTPPIDTRRTNINWAISQRALSDIRKIDADTWREWMTDANQAETVAELEKLTEVAFAHRRTVLGGA